MKMAVFLGRSIQSLRSSLLTASGRSRSPFVVAWSDQEYFYSHLDGDSSSPQSYPSVVQVSSLWTQAVQAIILVRAWTADRSIWSPTQ